MKAQIERYTNHGMALFPEIYWCDDFEWPKEAITARVEKFKDGGTKNWYILKYKYAKERINMLKQADPTRERQKYINWIIGLDINGTSCFPEDISAIRMTLRCFEALRDGNKVSESFRDIYKYKTVGELNRYLSTFDYTSLFDRTIGVDWNEGESWGGRPQKITEIPEGAKEVYNDNNFWVIEVREPRAGEILFKNTPWCVRNPKIFKEKYTPPFYLFLKDDFPFMLCDETSQRLQDIHNGRISRDIWIEVESILTKLNLKFDFYANTVITPEEASHVSGMTEYLGGSLVDKVINAIS